MEYENIATQINQTIEDITFLFEKIERKHFIFQLSNQQHVLLTLIIQHSPVSTTELAQKMNVTKSAVSQQLAKLEADRYITRKQSENDKRSFYVELDKNGLIYQEELQKYNNRLFDSYKQNLSYKELTDMLASFQKFKKVIAETE